MSVTKAINGSTVTLLRHFFTLPFPISLMPDKGHYQALNTAGGGMLVFESNEADTDLLRLNDLVKQHGLTCRTNGKSYQFDDRVGAEAFMDGDIYTASGLREALAFAEGFDRARFLHDK